MDGWIADLIVGSKKAPTFMFVTFLPTAVVEVVEVTQHVLLP